MFFFLIFIEVTPFKIFHLKIQVSYKLFLHVEACLTKSAFLKITTWYTNRELKICGFFCNGEISKGWGVLVLDFLGTGVLRYNVIN